MAKPVLTAPHFQNEEAAFEHVESALWPEGPNCPHCGNVDAKRITKMQGKTTRAGLYNCKECRKPFTVRMGTIFESSHLPLHLWLQVIHLMCASKKGIATRQIQRMLVCSMKTAWFLTHRIREAMATRETEPMGGEGETIEADETWIGGKAANRAFGPIPAKQSVMSLVQRNGGVRSFQIPNVTAANLYPIIARHTHTDSRFMTDEAQVYAAIGATFTEYQTVNHSAKEYVRDEAYTNTVEGYFSILKRGIYGVYQHVSEAHLKRYLAEFDFRYSNRAKVGIDDIARTDLAIKGLAGKRLTYRTTRGGRPAKASPQAGA